MTKDTSEYSSTKSPETREEAEEPGSVVDPRLIPGGAEPRTHTDQGMASLDRDTVPSRADDSGQTWHRDTSTHDVTGK